MVKWFARPETFSSPLRRRAFDARLKKVAELSLTVSRRLVAETVRDFISDVRTHSILFQGRKCAFFPLASCLQRDWSLKSLETEILEKLATKETQDGRKYREICKRCKSGAGSNAEALHFFPFYCNSNTRGCSHFDGILARKIANFLGQDQTKCTFFFGANWQLNAPIVSFSWFTW